MRIGSVRALGTALVLLAGVTTGATSALAGPNTGKLSLLIGNDITTAYFFRGILQERDGFITQPYGEVGIKLYESEGLLSSFSLFGGVWNSIHSEQTGASASPEVLYETDWYGGAQAVFGALTTRASYVAYTSPNDAFATVQEFDLSGAYDDSAYLGAFALKPSVLLAFETENTAFGVDEGIYVELGVAPGFNLNDSETYPVNLSFPMKLGLSGDDYYEDATGNDETVGYFSGGLKLGVPLAFIPSDYGTWSTSLGVNFLVLGEHTGDLNNEDFWTVGTWGVSMTY
jgi:hypothetical protein